MKANIWLFDGLDSMWSKIQDWWSVSVCWVTESLIVPCDNRQTDNFIQLTAAAFHDSSAIPVQQWHDIFSHVFYSVTPAVTSPTFFILLLSAEGISFKPAESECISFNCLKNIYDSSRLTVWSFALLIWPCLLRRWAMPIPTVLQIDLKDLKLIRQLRHPIPVRRINGYQNRQQIWECACWCQAIGLCSF